MAQNEDNQQSEMDQKRSAWRRVLIVTAVLVLYAYAIQATDINLQEPLEPQRQRNLVSLIRELARPDILRYKTETRVTRITLLMPCPEEVRGSQVTFQGRQITLAPNCATTTQDVLTLQGEGFPTDERGVVLWRPPGATARRVVEFRTGNAGAFRVQFTMPDVRPSEEPQELEVVEITDRRIVGFSEASRVTFERIIETILMALMASTLGTIIAVPLSFMAARNLMVDLKMPLAAIMGAIIAVPFGWWIGGTVFGGLSGVAAQVSDQTMMGLGAFVVASVLAWPVLHFGPPLFSDERRPASQVAVSLLRVSVVVALGFFSFGVLAHLGLVAGDWLRGVLGIFGFVGNFIYVLSDLLRVLLPTIMAAAGALVAASYGSRYGQEAVLRLSTGSAQLVTLIVTVVGTAVFVFSLLSAFNWICLLGMCQTVPQETPVLWVWLGAPALGLGLVAGLLSLRRTPKEPFPIGTITFNLVRGMLNGLRSIEPVLLGFVLVVWVGLGPFAGILALTLHSVADLGKLFSEQVENIAEGPLEAVTATGANRLQTIIYAVVPQIVPHYIAFIFYRWDINVRMATIIGFVGGGGIGLVLFRSANLTQYRAASVMVIAIAVVVATLDYISARIRSRII